MNKTDILSAMKSRILNAAITPNVAYPNVTPADDSLPLVEIEFAGGDSATDALDGSSLENEVGVLTVTVVIERNADGGEDTGNALAQAIKALFPAGLRLPITGGRVNFLQPASIRNGFPDKTSWRIPVTIQYRADQN